MAWTRLRAGVLRLETSMGPRFLKLTLAQRVLLLWVFRNFRTLTLTVLSGWERKLLERLCQRNQIVPWKGMDPARVIGAMEGTPYPGSSAALRTWGQVPAPARRS